MKKDFVTFKLTFCISGTTCGTNPYNTSFESLDLCRGTTFTLSHALVKNAILHHKMAVMPLLLSICVCTYIHLVSFISNGLNGRLVDFFPVFHCCGLAVAYFLLTILYSCCLVSEFQRVVFDVEIR